MEEKTPIEIEPGEHPETRDHANAIRETLDRLESAAVDDPNASVVVKSTRAFLELLTTHYDEGRESANEAGKWSIGFKLDVVNGAPIKIVVSSKINKAITDAIEDSVDREPGLGI